MIQVVKSEERLSYPPRVTSFTRQFWDGLRLGYFQTTQCVQCKHITFPPKPICPHCWHDEVNWVDRETSGTLYAWTRVHAGPAAFAAELPYAVGVVDLDCGLRLACRLWSEDSNEIWQCGMKMNLRALIASNGVLLVSTPEG